MGDAKVVKTEAKCRTHGRVAWLEWQDPSRIKESKEHKE